MQDKLSQSPFFDVFYILSCVVNGREVDWEFAQIYKKDDWLILYKLSQQHGVVAVVFDKLKNIPKKIAPPKDISLKWMSHSLSLEEQAICKENIAIEVAEKLSEKNIFFLVLKGMSYASYYPNSHHRESGDIDCFLFGKKEDGDKAVVEIGGRMEEAGYKHSHLYYKGLLIENHRYITSFNNTKLGVKTERLLQELVAIGYTAMGNTKLLKPSANFNAIFLVKHAQRHFIQEGIRIRHLLDWALFLKAEAANVDWGSVIPIMEECHILDFARVMTKICRDNIALDIDVAGLNGKSDMTNAVLDDMMSEQPNLFKENVFQKIWRIIRRFYRVWKFRSLADESYFRIIWNNIVFSSYMRRTTPQL